MSTDDPKLEPGASPEPDASPAPEEPGGAPETPEPAGPWQKLRDAAQNPAHRFVVAFLVYLGALAYLYPRASVRYSEAIGWLTTATATIEYHFFDLFSRAVTQHDRMVVFGGFSVQIIEECTGLYEILIYAAAVLAFPTTLVRKGIGIVFGAPLLYLINVLRIAFLMFTGRFYPDTFDFMHLYFWQATLILMITSVWLLWIFVVVRYEGNRPHAA
jgi:archaeosortase B (VPXXXP-CTERM-specific)